MQAVACYDDGTNGIEENKEEYVKRAVKLLDQLSNFRESEFYTSQIFYEIMRGYAETGNEIRAEEYLYKLITELVHDYGDKDLEPYIKENQVREFAFYLDIEEDIEDFIKEVKNWQNDIYLKPYKLIKVGDFFDKQ